MDHIHTFLTTQGYGGPPRMSDQLNAGATSETTQTWKTIHTKHTQSSQQGEYGMMITTAKWYSGTLGGLKFSDICLIGEDKPLKNLTQEICPDRGSNPGPLRDKRACYHLLHSGGPLLLYHCNLNLFITFILQCFYELKRDIQISAWYTKNRM